MSTAYWSAASALTVSDAFDAARVAIEAAMEEARSRSSPEGVGWASCFRCSLEYRLGRLGEAVADGQRALEVFDPAEFPLAHAYSLAFALDALVAAGELDVAEQLGRRHTARERSPARRLWPAAGGEGPAPRCPGQVG